MDLIKQKLMLAVDLNLSRHTIKFLNSEKGESTKANRS